MIQLIDHMKLKRKEDQRVDASVLLRKENKQSREVEVGGKWKEGKKGRGKSSMEKGRGNVKGIMKLNRSV